MSGWQPIETAPKDGTRVDLWVVDQDGRAGRVTDAYYRKDVETERSIFNPVTGGYGGLGRQKIVEDQWWAPNYAYELEDGPCSTSRHFNEVFKREEFDLPTHWMPVPGPPEQAEPKP